MVERHQDELVEDLGLWGVPSYRLSGPNGEPDLAVWSQDRLWLIAAEIRRRTKGVEFSWYKCEDRDRLIGTVYGKTKCSTIKLASGQCSRI
jgi:hypothetical protein